MAANAVIDFRHKDGANQLGGYADTTGYQPVNTPDKVNDRWRWQPLRVPLVTGKAQKALTPQWSVVVPFGMTSQYGGDVPGPPKLPKRRVVRRGHREPGQGDRQPRRPQQDQGGVLGRRAALGVPTRALGDLRPGHLPQARPQP